MSLLDKFKEQFTDRDDEYEDEEYEEEGTSMIRRSLFLPVRQQAVRQ